MRVTIKDLIRWFKSFYFCLLFFLWLISIRWDNSNASAFWCHNLSFSRGFRFSCWWFSRGEKWETSLNCWDICVRSLNIGRWECFESVFGISLFIAGIPTSGVSTVFFCVASGVSDFGAFNQVDIGFELLISSIIFWIVFQGYLRILIQFSQFLKPHKLTKIKDSSYAS